MTGVVRHEEEQALFWEIAWRIPEVCQPDKIVIFGSRGRGDHRPGSDVDVLVVAEADEPCQARDAPLYTALASLPVEVEMMVYTPLEIVAWREVRQALPTMALREGRVIYERGE